MEQESDRERAYDNLVEILLDIKSSFYRLDDIIEEIDRKHTTYMKNAVMRARFKLATGNNTEGKLLRILDQLADLGGFHNRTKRCFLKFLYQANHEKEYRHFGDIDAGGFYIFEHLKKKTGIPFETLHMNTGILKKYAADCKKLTENDRRRIARLLECVATKQSLESIGEDYSETLRYMLEHDCKLEQEALHQETLHE